MEWRHTDSVSLVKKKRSETSLMPPPPPAKRIKRPRKVLDEESYTEALSQIIARDFFPGLLETETKQEYLDALASEDSGWIASASQRLHNVMTPQRQPTTHLPKFTGDGSQTPVGFIGNTPTNHSSSQSLQDTRLYTNMSLSKFQATYTSEDNESFYRLVDKQNQKKADKYAWLWRGNKFPSNQMIKQGEVEGRLSLSRGLTDDGFERKRLAIKDKDDRPAQADTWKSNPRNGLMFGPSDMAETLPTVAEKAEQSSRAGPKSIMYDSFQRPQIENRIGPPSPTLSSVRDAIAGMPRQQDQTTSLVGGSETPRINGYSFVDDEDEGILRNGRSEQAVPPAIDLGPGDSNNPFKIQDQGKRETLHERLVDRIAKTKKDSLSKGFTGKILKTPAPSFPSSPRVQGGLTPAAQRLWTQIGTPDRNSAGNIFETSTPRRPRGSLLKSISENKT